MATQTPEEMHASRSTVILHRASAMANSSALSGRSTELPRGPSGPGGTPVRLGDVQPLVGGRTRRPQVQVGTVPAPGYQHAEVGCRAADDIRRTGRTELPQLTRRRDDLEAELVRGRLEPACEVPEVPCPYREGDERTEPV